MRRILFWLHLASGILCGLVILYFAATGAMLAYERPILKSAALRGYTASASGTALRLDDALARSLPALPSPPDSITLYRDPRAPIEIQAGDRSVYFVDPASGTLHGPTVPKLRAFFVTVTALHRWFGLKRRHHEAAIAVKGALTLLFVFLLLSGAILWLPTRCSSLHLLAGTRPRLRVYPRAQFYSWHKAAGFWLGLPLAGIALTGIVMAYPWANTLLFRMAGSTPPQNNARRNDNVKTSIQLPQHLNEAFAAASSASPCWRATTLRLPPRAEKLSFTVDCGDGGRPQAREQVTVDAATALVVERTPFASLERGRRWRTWVRFTHTGEAGGWWGQTIAFVSALGAVLLVVTGFLLSWYRLLRYRHHRRRTRLAPQLKAPDRELASR